MDTGLVRAREGASARGPRRAIPHSVPTRSLAVVMPGSTSHPPASRVTAFFPLLGLLKYGLALAALLAYLPFTTYRPMPLHGMLGNLFSELSPLSAFFAMLFALLTAWVVMIVTGLIVNGVELRFPRATRGRAYRTY